MKERLISGDNHIDLTYCPPDLWSSQAPAKWKLLVPRVEELEDGCHWFVDAQDKGMWNGVGPGFLKHTPGQFGHIDEMKQSGFECQDVPGAVKKLRGDGAKVDSPRDDLAWVHPRETNGLFVELRHREKYD